MVATDDNENDERVTSPDNAPPQIPLSNSCNGSHTSVHSHGGPSHGHSHGGASQMNMRGVFLHLLADALGSVIVIISALVIWFTDWEGRVYVDPALSCLMTVLILNSVWPLLQESALILLQTVPTHIQIDELQQKLLTQVDGVIAVHEFHIWQLAGDRIIASAHIRCRNLADYMKIAEKVKEFFHNEGIHSTTIQPEFVEQQYVIDSTDENNQNCYLVCPYESNNKCAANSCCGPQQDSEEHHHHSHGPRSNP
jgi:zinc transporter 1